MTQALVHELVGYEPDVTALSSGVTSLLYRIDRSGHSPTVVKVFDPARGSEFGHAAVSLEVAALRAVANIQADGVRFVRPVRAWPDRGAYEMEHIAGRPLVDALASDGLEPTVVARQLVLGLREFAAHAACPFGDLHLGNVVAAHDGTLVFLDPIDAPTVRRVAAGQPAPTWDQDDAHAADLETLVVIETLRWPRRLRSSISEGLAVGRLVRAFAAIAALDPVVSGRAGYRRSVRNRLRVHAETQGRRGRLKLVYRRPSLELMLLSTYRLASRSPTS